MYMGAITKWDDARIKALNPQLKLPSQAIAPVYRSDGSGTNFLFTNYLSQVSRDFASKIGANTSVQWPVGIGAKGNEGVANMTARTSGAIGYVEYAYAKQNKLTYARLKNRDGQAVAPDATSFQAAAASSDWSRAKDFYLILTNQPGAKSWPITGASFILMHRNVAHAPDAVAALKFFDWAYHEGGAMAQQLDYVPLPDDLVKQVESTWQSAITADGKPIWTK
jgi:phosphate transport system substrate-binding protein